MMMDFGVFLLLNAVLFIRPGEFVESLAGLQLYNNLMILNLVAAGPKLVVRSLDGSLGTEPITLGVLGLFAAIVLSQLARFDLGAMAGGAVEFGKVVIYFVLMTTVVTTPARLRVLLATLVGCIALVLGLALLHYFEVIEVPALATYDESWVNPATGERVVFARLRTTGIFNDPNDLSQILLVGLGGAAFLATPRNGRLPRPHWLVAVGLFLVGLVLTRSRGGFLALLAALTALLQTRFGAVKGGFLLALSLPVALILFGGRQTAINTAEDDTGQHRIQFWVAGFEMLRGSPLTGVGYGRFADHAPMAAHNSYIHAFGELGLFGGACFFGATYYAVATLIGLRRHEAAIAEPDLRRLRPFLAAMVFGYAFSMLTLSRCYVNTTFMVLGLATTYLRLVGHAAPALLGPGRPIATPDLRLLGRLALANVAFLVLLNLFIKATVRSG